MERGGFLSNHNHPAAVLHPVEGLSPAGAITLGIFLCAGLFWISLFGLMLATALPQALMSNTAITAMMITVITPSIATPAPGDRFRTALAFSIPVAANLGGIARPIGTPPNALDLIKITAYLLQEPTQKEFLRPVIAATIVNWHFPRSWLAANDFCHARVSS